MKRVRYQLDTSIGPLVFAALATLSGSGCIVPGAEDEYRQCVIEGRCVQPGPGGDGGGVDGGGDGGASSDAGGESDGGDTVDGGTDAGTSDAGQDGGSMPDAGTGWPPKGWTNPHAASAEFPPNAQDPTISDDGKTLCYRVVPRRAAPSPQCRLLDGGEFGPAIGSSGEVIGGTDYALAGNGTRLYYVLSGTEVKYSPISNGMMNPIGTGGVIGGSGATSPAAHPENSDHVFAVDVLGQILEKTAAGALSWLPEPINDPTWTSQEVDVAPSGEFILFTRTDTTSGDQSLWAARRVNGTWEEPIQLTVDGLEPTTLIKSPEVLRDGRLLFVGTRQGAGVEEILYADPKP